MTRNTKIYKILYPVGKKKEEVYYRDLTAMEYAFVNNIKNETIKRDLAARKAILYKDPDTLPIGTRITIGDDLLNKINNFLSSKQLFEITVSEFRENIKHDDFMIAIKHILTCLPGQSFTDLLNLNIKDLLELVCLCEYITGKPILDIGKKHGLVNKNNLPDDGKSLQEKMNALNSFMGIPK
jgi:hypothetical protein